LTEEEIVEQKKLDHLQRVKRVKELNKNEEKKEPKVVAEYKCLHPEIFTLKEEFFVPSFLKAIQEKNLSAVMKEESARLYSFDMFTPTFCQKLMEESLHYENSGLPVDRPNSMNLYGVVLNSIGFKELLTELMEKYIKVISSELFADFGGKTVDSHHSFIVRYKVNEDIDLDTHTDDSEVTLNVCLGRKFEGASLYFYGIKGTSSENQEDFRYTHLPGKAIIHLGRHIHGVNRLISGERINLIVWCRSSEFRSNSLKPSYQL